MHREHRASEGACVRATWVKVGSDQIDRGIRRREPSVARSLRNSRSVFPRRGLG
jgi:hypothetical protein